MVAAPLHLVLADGGLEWAASTDFSYGLPKQTPPPHRLATTMGVLQAFRSAGCHGTPWFTVKDVEATDWLPSCPAPAQCATEGSIHLGEK